MKGLKVMVIAATTTVMALACAGCVSAPDAHTHVFVPAAAPSQGMVLAAGPDLGLPDERRALNVQLVEPAPRAFGVVGPPQALPGEADLMTQPPVNFEIAPGFAAAQELTVPLWSGNDAVEAIAADRARARLMEPTEIEQNIAAEIAFSAPREATGFGFDLGVAPRIQVRNEGEFLTQRFGGEVRIGQNLDLTAMANGDAPEGWYIFAGADGEALVWDAGRDSLAPSLDSMALREQVTVGDLQAGVSIQRAGGQLSLSYIRREVRYEDRNGGYSDNEDFAGVSFTLRR